MKLFTIDISGSAPVGHIYNIQLPPSTKAVFFSLNTYSSSSLTSLYPIWTTQYNLEEKIASILKVQNTQLSGTASIIAFV